MGMGDEDCLDCLVLPLQLSLQNTERGKETTTTIAAKQQPVIKMLSHTVLAYVEARLVQ